MKRETIFGLAGGAILLAAMVGVFQYEGSRASSVVLGSESYDVAWSTNEVAGPGKSGELAPREGKSEAIDVALANLTATAFTLEWTDDVGGPDVFRFTVVSPEGVRLSVTGASGKLTLSFTGLNAIPARGIVFADDESEAERTLASKNTRRAGTGAWNATVELLEAAGQTTPVGGIPLQPDPGNAWAIATAHTVYVPTLTPKR